MNIDDIGGGAENPIQRKVAPMYQYHYQLLFVARR